MSEVTVVERATVAATPPPVFKIDEGHGVTLPRLGETEWIANVVGRGAKGSTLG